MIALNASVEPPSLRWPRFHDPLKRSMR
jgi:hypothetical protein